MNEQENTVRNDQQKKLTEQEQKVLAEAQRKMGLKPFNREDFAEAKEMIRQHAATKATVNLRMFLEANVAELLTWGVKSALMFEILSKKFNIGNRNSFNTIWKEVKENHKKALKVQRAQERARIKAQKEIANENDGGNGSLELEKQDEQVTLENLTQDELKYAPTDSDISDCYNAILKVKVPGKGDKNKNFANVKEIRDQFPSWPQELFEVAMHELIENYSDIEVARSRPIHEVNLENMSSEERAGVFIFNDFVVDAIEVKTK